MQRTTAIDVSDWGYDRPGKLTAIATLRKIGEQVPYFSLTGEIDAPTGEELAGGMLHDYILTAWPDLADLAALHLSTVDGEPMHAEADGWYHLAGYLGVRRTFWNEEGTWGRTEYINNSSDSLGAFASHVRLSRDDASRLASWIVRQTVRGLDDPDALYKAWIRECDKMRPRWKEEANAAIARHGL